MSVEKYRLVKESGNYTVIPNKILQGLKNYEALGLYAYLASLPDGWEFYKSQLQEHGDIGRDKLKKLLDILSAHNLVIFTQGRNPDGTFGDFKMHVKNGNDFIIPEMVIKEPKNEPSTEKPLTVNRLPVNSTYKYNRSKSLDLNKRIKKSSLSQKDKNERRHDFAESMDQMACEARNIEQNEEFKRAPVPDNIKCLLGLSGFKS